MVTTKCTTPKALQFNIKQQGTITNNGVGESSFRVLYYGKSSAGSIPFMWESHPGTPKHATTESSLPPLTPPPAYQQSRQKYNPLEHTTSLRTLFLSTSTSKKTWSSTSDYSTSYDSSSKQSSTTSLRSLFLASSSTKSHVAAAPSISYSLPSTPVSKGQGKSEFRRKPTSVLCFGGGFMKVYKMKKVKNVLMSIGNHGKKKKVN